MKNSTSSYVNKGPLWREQMLLIRYLKRVIIELLLHKEVLWVAQLFIKVTLKRIVPHKHDCVL